MTTAKQCKCCGECVTNFVGIITNYGVWRSNSFHIAADEGDILGLESTKCVKVGVISLPMYLEQFVYVVTNDGTSLIS